MSRCIRCQCEKYDISWYCYDCQRENAIEERLGKDVDKELLKQAKIANELKKRELELLERLNVEKLVEKLIEWRRYSEDRAETKQDKVIKSN